MIPFDVSIADAAALFSNISPSTALYQETQNSFADSTTALPPPAPLCIPAVSCSLDRIPNLDGCCINHPSGHFLSTQFWDTKPPLGANDTWTVHGLWPDYCKGGFDAFCNSSRALSGSDVRQIISDADANGTHPGLSDFMNQKWKSTFKDASQLWAHEWNKHGTCISTLEIPCYDRDQQKPDPPEMIDSIDVLDYFTHAVLLYNSLPTFQFFADHDIIPSHDTTYTLEQLQSAIKSSSHGMEATIHCRNHNELSEIWYHFNVRGSLRHAMEAWWDGNKMWSSWVPAGPDGQTSRCPKEGIKYLPKGIDWHDQPPFPPTTTHKTSTATSTSIATSTSTSIPSNRPFVGKGRLMVKVLDPPSDLEEYQPNTAAASPIPKPYTGCLIRHGTWYNARSLTSCAIFTADDDIRSTSSTDDDTTYHLFTLASRFAPCSFVPTLASIADTPNTSDATSSTLRPAHFSCSPNLTFQTIFSNNATLDEQHTQNARKLTVGRGHESVFWSEGVPGKNGKVDVWRGREGEGQDNVGEGGEKGVKVEIYWVAV